MAGNRVFKEEIGPWPKVYETGPGCFEVVARHKDPNRLKLMTGISYIPPAGLAYVMLPTINPENWGFVLVGTVVGGMLLSRFTRAMLGDLPFLVKRTTRIRFENGQIKWGKFTIGANMPRQFRSEKHRRALQNARQLQEKRDKTAIPTFKDASEVFIDSGEGWMHPRVVAEIASDEFGELAHLLATVLRFVDKRSRGYVETPVRPMTVERIH